MAERHSRIRRTIDRPDSIEAQVNSLYRCTECAFESVSVPIKHAHLNMLVCIGDALADQLRIIVPSDCPFILQRKKKPTIVPPTATKVNCTLCTAPILMESWNFVCFIDGAMFCKDCIDAGRCFHRHQLFWVRPIHVYTVLRTRPALTFQCDICRGSNYSRVTLAWECVGCRNWQACQSCLKGNKNPTAHPICQDVASSWELSCVLRTDK